MISEERQDIFSLSTSFFTHLYFTHLPWRIPLSEVPHESPSLFCTLNILSFLRIFSICLCPLWPPNLLTHPSSSKGDNLFFLFKYFCLVLKSHHESQFPFHSYYTLFLLFSISGFHFNPSDASVSCPWSPVKSILISSCAFPLDHHPPTSVTLSARTLKFFHSPLWKLCLSPYLLVPLLLSQWPPACSCPHIRSVSLTPDKEPQLPLCLPHFPHCQQALHLCSYCCLSCSLGLPGADRHHRELRAFSGSWHFTAPQQLHTYQAAPILHCGEKTICHGVRIKDFTVKYQTSEGKRVTQICR